MIELNLFYLFIIVTLVVPTCITSISTYDIQKAFSQSSVSIDQPTKFTIENPPGWDNIKGNSPQNIMIYRAPAVNETGVGVYAIDLPYTNISLGEYDLVQISSLNQSYDVLQHNRTSISDMPAYQAVYTDPSKGTTALEIWTIKDNTVFKIIYLASSNHFVDYLSDAKRIINSFQFR